MKRIKVALCGITLLGLAHAALADDGILSQLETAATSAISSMSTTLGVVLVAGFAIAVGFVGYRLVKKGLNRAA